MAARFSGATPALLLVLAVTLGTCGCFIAATPTATSSAALQSSCVPVNGGMVSWWDGDHVGGGTAYDIWGSFDAMMTNVGSIPGEVGNAFWFPGYGSSISAPYKTAFSATSAISVVAWVNPGFGATPGLSQTILEQGSRQAAAFTTASSWTSYNAANTDGSGTDVGYVGAVFDGRYIYYIPDFTAAFGHHGLVLRYDTQSGFSTASAWASYDASGTNGVGADVGYAGAVFDGRYIYFVPGYNGTTNANVLRYDTTGGFTSAGSWAAYNAKNTDGANTNIGYEGGAFDGRYVYFAPGYNGTSFHGLVLRYDTTGGFTTTSSWLSYDASNTDGSSTDKGYTGAVFDGRYMYFTPVETAFGSYSGKVLRYDTTGSFTTTTSWSSYDASNTDGASDNTGFYGGVFDGRYIYFVPDLNTSGYYGKVLRYDTKGSFTAGGSWASYDASNTDGSNGDKGFAFAVFDGRFVYFVPDFNGSVQSGEVLRYDTTSSFTSAGSWSSFNAANTDGSGGDTGFTGAVFDGRFVYFAPVENNTAVDGEALRLDTGGSSSSYSLMLTQASASGLASSTTGPDFQVNTSAGHFGAYSTALLSAGWHLVAGVYDGANVSVYVDGALSTSAPASGSLVVNTSALTIGAPGNSNSGLYGGLDEVQLYNTALPAGAIANIYRAGPNGVCKP